MQKKVILGLLLTCFIMIAGCSSSKIAVPSKATPLEGVSTNYSLEDAKKDGCLIMINGDVEFGQEAFDKFIDKTKKGEYASLRVFDYYELPDPSHYDEEYYEEIKNEYPKTYVRELVYENGTYMEFFIEDESLMMREFKYLIEDHFEAPSGTSLYTDGIAYFLCNRDDVTLNNVLMSAASSDSNAFIPFSVIYQLRNYK